MKTTQSLTKTDRTATPRKTVQQGIRKKQHVLGSLAEVGRATGNIVVPAVNSSEWKASR